MKIKYILIMLGLVLGKMVMAQDGDQELGNVEVGSESLAVNEHAQCFDSVTVDDFFNAIYKEDIGFLSVFLSHNPGFVNITNSNGIPALHKVVQTGSIAMAALFLLHDSSIEIESNDGWSPLAVAIYSNLIDMARWLLNNKANTIHVDRHGKNALHWAAEWSSADMVSLLADHYNDLNLGDEEGDTPLHIAARANKVDNMLMLIERKAIVSVVNDLGQTPLHVAAKAGRLEAVQALVEKGLSIDAQDLYGRTPLYLAVIKDREAVADYLIRKGAHMCVKDALGNTPVTVAYGRNLYRLYELMKNDHNQCMKCMVETTSCRVEDSGCGYRNLPADDGDWEMVN